MVKAQLKQPGDVGGSGDPQIVGGAYEGADRIQRGVALWQPSRLHPDDEISRSKPLAVARSRDLLRNDAFVQNAQTMHKNSIVGEYFALSAKPAWRTLRMDEKWALEFQQEVEEKFYLYAESMQNWIDASRRMTLTELTRLQLAMYLPQGETISTVEWLRDAGRPYHTAIQCVDIDRLETPPEFMNDERVNQGVRKNFFGAPVGYYIRLKHPAKFTMSPDQFVYKFVPAAKPWGRKQVLHILEPCRPDQTRGVSELVSALKESRLAKQFRDVTLQNAIVNATFAATIESELPTQTVYEQLGAGKSGDAVTEYSRKFLTAVADYGDAAKNATMDGARIPHLFPGTKLNMHKAGVPGGVGQEFEQSLLRYMAASVGVSYEELSKDYTNTNYSSARAAMLETWKYMQARKKIVADRFATTVYCLWLEEAINAQQIEAMKTSRAPSFYDGQNKDALTSCEWIGAARGQIDELKETEAAVMRIENNLSTLERECARFGTDWLETLTQRQRERLEETDRDVVPVARAAANKAPDEDSEPGDAKPKAKTARKKS